MGSGIVFQMGWGSFLSGGVPMGGASVFGGGILEKNRKIGGWGCYGKPCMWPFFVQYRFI